jgi:hypothetical protein
LFMGWKHFDLFDFSAPKARTVPSAYTFEAQATQHVIYTGEDGHIYEVLWSRSEGWLPYDLTYLTGAPPQPASHPINGPIGYVFVAQGTQHVIFVSSSPSQGDPGGHIHELWRDNSGWHHRDLTSDIRAPLAFVFAPPCAYVFDAQGTQHVDYVGRDGHINELWWNNDGWHHNDLTNAAGAPLAALNPRPASPKGYAFAGSHHVVYIAKDGTIHELFWNNFSWGHRPLTAASDNVPAQFSGPLAAYAFAAQGSQHVDYVGAGGRIFEVWWDSGGVHCDDLIADAGAAPADNPSVLCAYVFDAQGTRHVDFTGGVGHINELWWNPDGWHYSDLTRAAGGAPLSDQGDPAGYAFAAQGTQHVFYIGIEVNHIHELRWTPVVSPVVPVGPALG